MSDLQEIEGVAESVSNQVADNYFDSRSENSRLGAWASNQSSILSNRNELEKKVIEYKEKFKGKKITRPIYWSGFKIKPKLIEFWQEMPFRLHDRVEFIRSDDNFFGRRLYP